MGKFFEILFYLMFMVIFIIMKNVIPNCNKKLYGSVVIPSDKSISHRALMFASLAKGKSVIKNCSCANDPLTTFAICRMMGVNLSRSNDGKTIIVTSDGKLSRPTQFVDCGNSGTTMRILCGILAAQPFNSVLIGDDSLMSRPMKRVIEPLTLMGANLSAVDYQAPIHIFSAKLHGITYSSDVASAQAKSSILAAGLLAEGETVYTEPSMSRNHTELMLKYMNADIDINGTVTKIRNSEIEPRTINVVGDISSAAFFMVAATIVPGSDVILQNVGLNPTRTGIIDVLLQMGADIEILDKRTISGELTGDIRIRYAELKGCNIGGELIPRLIDELPIIAVLATQAEGTTIVTNAEELRMKETDRIFAIVKELRKLGADITDTPDGFIVNGKCKLKGAVEVETFQDHRLAMSLYVAGMVCDQEIVVRNFDWVNISFPEFEALMNELM